MAVAFYSDDSAVLSKRLQIKDIQYSNESVENSYDLEYCKKWLSLHKFQRVALQFPDGLLHDSVAVEKWLKSNINDIQLFILADTSYGSCCVDEVAAEHYKADCIIHFGHACLSPSRRLPVFYLFNKSSIDPLDCVGKLRDLLPDPNVQIAILYEVSYFHTAKKIYEEFEKEFQHCVLSKFIVDDNACVPTDCHCDSTCKPSTWEDNPSIIKCGARTLKLPESDQFKDYIIYFIGQEGLTLTNLMMNWNQNVFYSYNPENKICRKECLNVNKVLMKRYFLIEKIKDAKIVGILVGTLGVANYLQVMERLKVLLKRVGKKYYTFVVGKLNVAKLANFMEIDLYVYVSCPENSLVDSSDFYRPVVTPFEVELACNSERQWTGEYVTDFQDLLPGGRACVAFSDSPVEETVDVSLVTGSVRTLGLQHTEDTKHGNQVLDRNQALQVSLTPAGEYLQNREWKGLEADLGATPVTKAVQGRRGIAIAYEEEPSE